MIMKDAITMHYANTLWNINVGKLLAYDSAPLQLQPSTMVTLSSEYAQMICNYRDCFITNFTEFVIENFFL